MTGTAVEKPVKTSADYILPPSVVSKTDVSRMVTDAERVDSEMTTAAVRAEANAHVQTPTPQMSQQLADFLALNELSFGNDIQRGELIKQLRAMKDKAPIVHMTFAVEADRESLSQLAQWLRASVHPQAVIAVGLQPGLIAGVYLRSTNHVYDMSLKAKLDAGHGILVKELEALRGGKEGGR